MSRRKNDKMIRSLAIAAIAAAFFLAWLRGSADATVSYTATQTTALAEFLVGSSATLTFRISNNSTTETMSRVRFYVTGSYTYFPNQTVTVPPGFTSCSLSSQVTVSNVTYYQRISCSGSLSSGSSQTIGFKIINLATSTTTDRTDKLSNLTARFTTSGNYGYGTNYYPSNSGYQGGWTWKALQITLVPSAASVGSGCQFTLTMNVTNKTNSSIGNVASVVSPPAPVYTGGASLSLIASPANITVPAGASAPLVWTYTLNGPANGTAAFSACASASGTCTSTSGTTKTSSTVSSVPISIASGASCGFTTAISSSPTCLFSGGTAVFTMTVTNGTGGAAANVTPGALTPVVTGAAQISSIVGPSPSSISSLPTGSTGMFTWTAVVTGNANDTYAMTGNASANGGSLISSTATSTAQELGDYSVLPSPPSTNASSSNQEIKWAIVNNACANINQVSIAVPAGWTVGDAYSSVTNSSGTQVDSWSTSGTTFTSPSSADRIPPTAANGDFYILFSSTPSSAGTYTFNVTITDDASPTPLTVTKSTVVTVNAFGSGGSGGPNSSSTAVWHENVP
jgi:hypothetical protein